MTNKLTSIIIGIVLVIGMGTLVYVTKKPAVLPVENTTTNTTANNTIQNPVKTITGGTTTTTTTTSQTTTQTTSSPEGITLAQVASHNSRASCWSAINGSVYDLTSWISNHPGGENAILSICGIDGSNAYNGQHGGSSKPARILGGFKLGALTQ